MDWQSVLGIQPRPHQLSGHEQILAAIGDGYRCICAAAPCRSGKTASAAMLIHHGISLGWSTAFYVNRRMIATQTMDRFAELGIDFGMRMAGHDPALLRNIQIASVQTEGSRVLRRKARDLHKCQLAIFDEGHLMSGETPRQIIKKHLDDGAVVVLFTATPANLPEEVEKLIVYAKNSDLRKQGIIVPAVTIGCAECDVDKVKKLANGEFSPQELRRVYRIQQIVGHVVDNWEKYNTDRKPGIMFAPGVPESRYLTQSFGKRGIAVAHVDANSVYFNEACPRYRGETFDGDSGQAMRRTMMQMSKDGELALVSSRHVLKEGVDGPWWSVCVAATPFGSPISYIQSCSRILTACPEIGKESALLLDFGGNWHRAGLGSINADREWELGCTPAKIAGEALQKRLAGEDAEPIRCGNCGLVRSALYNTMGKCPACGWKASASVRPVLQASGQIKMLEGNVTKQRRQYHKPDAEKEWKSMYYRGRKAGMTFSQCEALFAKEHNWQFPTRGLPYMPKSSADWLRKVKDVPADRLHKPTVPENIPQQQAMDF